MVYIERKCTDEVAEILASEEREKNAEKLGRPWIKNGLGLQVLHPVAWLGVPGHPMLLKLRYFVFDILILRYFAFDILSLNILSIGYFTLRYFDIRYFNTSIYCFRYFAPSMYGFPYFVISILSIAPENLRSMFNIRYFVRRYFA